MSWLDTQDPEKVAAQLAAIAENPGRFERVTRYGNGDERFGLWLVLVDRRLTKMVGVGLFDLADWAIYDAYESGLSPREAALEALRNDDTYAALVEEAGL